jgi:hypothetical protein
MSRSNESIPAACRPHGVTNERALEAFDLRFSRAKIQAEVPIPAHATNGDEERYPDKIGTYTKCILQDAPALVNIPAYKVFRHATRTGEFSDYEKVPLGGTRTLNGPEASYAYAFEGTDGWQFGSDPSPNNQESEVIVPPAPPLASEAYGTELIELYWGSLLRDVAFTDYHTNSIAAQAAAELSTMPAYAGPRDPATGKVTPDLLFRGTFAGETTGPHMSQFLITPTNMGAQPITQKVVTYVPNVDYMSDLDSLQKVQQGISTGLSDQPDPVLRYLHDGRGLAAYTHVDQLYQAYFTAYLVLESLNLPRNPGNPYAHSKTQNGFGTFGPPDFAATLAQVAKIALNAVWFQKWVVHLRHRPESGGGIVHLIKTGKGGTLSGRVNSNVLNSVAVAESYQKYGSYLLSQTFPEGSPAHPAYPTGHGTVGGACITVIKFFFDGDAVMPSPKVPSSDGLSLLPYSGADAGEMKVSGELNKLARDITFGHGIHAGIHWRSDSDYSMLLGEAMAISILQGLAQSYREKFKISFTKLDGSTAAIGN